MALSRTRANQTRLTSPLFELVSWVESISSALPQSLSPDSSHWIGPQPEGFEETHHLKSAITILLEEIRNLQSETQELGRMKGTMEVAAQVAHDIRSPLAALGVIENELGNLSEEKRLIIRSALNRIKDIANNLITQNKAMRSTHFSRSDAHKAGSITPEPLSIQLLPSLINLITEKRIQFRSKIGMEIDAQLGASAYGLFRKFSQLNLNEYYLTVLALHITSTKEAPPWLTTST